MAFVEHQGARIHWDEQGTGTPLLLIMGATYSSKMWWPVIPSLAEKHRVIWFDNRGTGESTAAKAASISDMAGDAMAVLDAAGVSTAAVYGVSLGGVVALEVGLTYPSRVTALILGCTGILSADKPRAPKALQLLLRLPRAVLLRMAKESSYGSACPPGRAAQDLAVLRADSSDPVALIAQQRALRDYSVEASQVAAMRVPALVLHGTEDKRVAFAWGKELADTLPGARLISYEGAGHNYVVACGDAANRDVLAFLDLVTQSQQDRPSSRS